ncbi:carbohydrate ABC transporter substrate-binding protein [Massilia sp. RP-1-19]|uniref:Probable sugar-binding periplasmic protein n=1 Tax=Massilia polaris TaxID=2728846 RepID=A0A848HN63_9BURK|nr:ABC transporter substrate-binding protein [Massilia polaris]NML61261.1 carbohydrate ABC transporter substrate-binding protein [Massilia polaris]
MTHLPLTSLIVMAAAALGASSAAQAAQVEVLHYWTSGGEARSIAELKKTLAARGVNWKDFAVAGGAGENAATALKARVMSGGAPTAAQVKGPAIQEWGQEGVLANIDAVARSEKWDALLPPAVASIMKYKGSYVAAPVNVHRVNWLWVNPAVLKKAGATAPATLDEFFAAADKIKAAGMIAVAHGGQPWQDATLFESVALGVGGAGFYKQALVQLDPAALTGPVMIKTFDTLARIKTYIDRDSAGRDWNLATAMIINGKAGMQFMGDWAKGEFTAAGKQAGADFLCLPAPGTAAAYTFNIDSMLMFQKPGADDQKSQQVLASAIMSPQFQEVFSLNKGSIPVRAGVPKTRFDSCAQRSMADMDASSKAGSFVPSLAHNMAVGSAAQGAIMDVIARFMNSTMSSKDAVAALAKAARTK